MATSAVRGEQQQQQQQRASALADGLAETRLYWDLRRQVRTALAADPALLQGAGAAAGSPTKAAAAAVGSADPAAVARITRLLGSLGLLPTLHNALGELHRRQPDAAADAAAGAGASAAGAPPRQAATMPISNTEEPFDYIRASQAQWWRMVFERLNSLATKAQLPLARLRQQRGTKAPAIAPQLLIDGFDPAPLKRETFLYDWRDVLQFVTALRNPNFVPEGVGLVDNSNSSAPGTDALACQGWGSVQVQFHVKSIADLRRQFVELDSRNPQAGVDEGTFAAGESEPFREFWLKHGRKALDEGFDHAVAELARRGVSNSLRPKVWSRILCPLSFGDELVVEPLLADVCRHDLLADKLILCDIATLCNYDDNYFVFEDLMKSVLLCFARDSAVAERLPSPRPKTPLARMTRGSSTGVVTYPPNGVLPFRGLAAMLAPLCFIYDRVENCYPVFRELYLRHFCHLHTISSHPKSIMRLSQLFEALLQAHQPTLFLHLKDIGVSPLRIAMPWMLHAFATFLEVEQVLLLWDRIIGFDSLELLPVLAAAVFGFRRQALLASQSASEVESILGDLKALQSVPLLQYCLYAQAAT